MIKITEAEILKVVSKTYKRADACDMIVWNRLTKNKRILGDKKPVVVDTVLSCDCPVGTKIKKDNTAWYVLYHADNIHTLIAESEEAAPPLKSLCGKITSIKLPGGREKKSLLCEVAK